MVKRLETDLHILNEFLRIKTPACWLDKAINNIPLLLIDHAHCERKAAATALHFINKYPDQKELVSIMSPLAREELLHFEKVCALMNKRGIIFGPLQPSEYATTLHKKVSASNDKQRLADLLIVGAIIEARSCERFNALLPLLPDPELVKFYRSLVQSEARHFEDYLRLAHLYGTEVNKRINDFLSIENKFISATDTVFRFHSGIPDAPKEAKL